MQDSIEDYIKISHNKKENLISEQRRQEILITAQRKKECEIHSLKVVEFLIEGKLRPEAFLKCLKHINQELYQDVVEERMLTKLCGYPLCGKKLPEMPKKQYHISTKSNKIYNIVEHKKYCSNVCYNGSIYIKKQIETSPLWLRNLTEDPKFHLLPDTERIVPGELVTHIITKEEINENFVSVSHFTECSLDEMGGMEANKNTKRKFGLKRNSFMAMNTINETETNNEDTEIVEEKNDILNTINENATEIIEERIEPMNTINEIEKNNENANEIIEERADTNCNAENFSEIKQINSKNTQKPETCPKPCGSGEFKKEIQKNPKHNLNHNILKFKEKINNLKCSESKPTANETKNKLSNCKIFKSEDEKLKAIIAKCQAKGKTFPSVKLTDPLPIKQTTKLIPEIKHHTQSLNTKTFQSTHKQEEKLDVTPKSVDYIKKYIKEWLTMDTCIFLNGYNKVKDVLTEKKLVEYFDNLKINERSIEQQMKYMTICKRLQLREMAEEKFDKATINSKFKPLPDYKQLKEESKDMNLKVRSFYDGSLYETRDSNFPVKPEESDNKSPSSTPILALNNWSSQNILRRKILFASTNKSLKYHIDKLNLNVSKILEDVQLLIKTLNLKADNIVFKPGQWDIVSFVFIKLLAIKNKEISVCLNEEVQQEYVKSVLDKMPGSYEFIEELLNFIQNIDFFVENYVGSNS